MNGVVNSVQAKISEIYRNALFDHCSSHSLNLSISSFYDVQQIRQCRKYFRRTLPFKYLRNNKHWLRSSMTFVRKQLK